MESCDLCHEEWFDLKVENGVCENCRKSSKFQPSNNMYPGDGAFGLPELTQMEEMLISPVHALVQLWQIRGGQTKYTGHTCNFPRENTIGLIRALMLVAIFLQSFSSSLMDILVLKHLHGKALIHLGFQLYLQLHNGRQKQENP